MGTMTRGTRAAALAAIALVGLSACSTTSEATPAAPSSSRTAAPTPSSTAVADTVDFGSAPSRNGVPACVDLLPDELVTAIVPTARAVDPLAVPHLDAAGLAAVVATGASCLSSNGVAPLDDTVPGRQGDPVFEGIELRVLPDAAPEFADATGRSLPGEDRTTPSCSASDSARVSCTGGLVAGSAWVDLSVQRVQASASDTPDQVLPRFRALLEHARDVVAGSGLGARATEHASGDWRFTDCSPATVNTVTSRALQDLTTGSDLPAAQVNYALNRIGGAACVFTGPGDGGYVDRDAVYAAVPDGGWAVEQRLASGVVDRRDRLDLEGLGPRDAAWRTCDQDACSIDVVQDGDWEHYLLFARSAPDTADAIERWVTASISG